MKTATAQETNRTRILARFKRMFCGMLCLGRDDHGYPTKGIDVVPERKSTFV